MEQPDYFTFSIQAGTPPPLNPRTTLPRVDEVNTIINLLKDSHTKTVLITGMSGVGKSTLAALVFSQFQSQALTGPSGFQSSIWLRLGSRTTWPDVITALLNALQVPAPKTEHLSQRTDLQTLYKALCRPEKNALIVLDQCEDLFERAIEAQNQAMPYTVGVGLSSAVRFLELLQQDLGESRIVLTCTNSPYGSNYAEAPGIREYAVGGLTIVDGINLLQQRNIQGTQQDLSIAWQHCSGHVYALLLLNAWKNLSGLALPYLLNSPLYQILWEGDIVHNLLEVVIGILNPVQFSITHALCLFREAVPLAGIVEVAEGERQSRGLDTPLFEQEMATLTALSLVEQVEGSVGDRRYQLHKLFNQYLLEHYLASEQRRNSGYLRSALGVTNQPDSLEMEQEASQIALAAGQMRVAAYYGHVAQQRPPQGQQRTNPNEIAPLLAMLEHSCLGWHWQMAYDQLNALHLDEDLLRWELWHTLIKLYEMLLPPVGSIQRRDEGLVHSALGMIYGRLGEYEQSRTYYTNALAIQRDMQDQRNEAITLINEGEFLRALGDDDLARQNFEQALSLLQPESEPQLRCVLLHNVGLLEQQQGHFQQSLQSFLQSLQIAKQVHDSEKEGKILTNIGLLLCEQRRFADGMALLLPALQMRHARRDPSIDTLIAFLSKLEQKMGKENFVSLRQTAQLEGKQEQVLRSIKEI